MTASKQIDIAKKSHYSLTHRSKFLSSLHFVKSKELIHLFIHYKVLLFAISLLTCYAKYCSYFHRFIGCFGLRGP